MKVNQTLTALVAAGLLGLMSAPVMARNTTGVFDTAVKENPPIVLAQESPEQQRHEEQRYQEQMREDQNQHKAQQETAMHHSGHHYKHKHHYKHHTPSVGEENNHNANDAH
jgi:hypothetical protein